jgi:DNA mismatch repair protein MutL
VVNRIAAGEVVERPASVVKELLENAIDSGAARVDVGVEQGGIALVRVTDDGGGIEPEDLPLAVENHATSKLRQADDLAEVATLGFRGEALSSIGEVARLVIRSRPPSRESGAMIEIDCGEAKLVVPCGGAVGTTVEVHQLFAKIPARRAFLRTASTEWAHVSDAFTRTALAHPSIAMTLSHNGRAIHELPAVENWLDRIAGIHGGSLAERLLAVRAEADGAMVEGWVGRPEDDMASTRLQQLFVNGRPFRDRSILHAVQEAYRGLLLTGRQPIVFLRIVVEPSQVDVNVHPAKTEVRFREPSKLHQLVLAAVRTSFLSADLAARLVPPVDRRPEAEPRSVPSFRPHTTGGGFPLRGEIPAAAIDRRRDPSLPFDAAATAEEPSGGLAATILPSSAAQAAPRAIQMHDRYLVVETPEGIEVIDQHALHERVLFAEMRESLAGGTLESQRLLVPETVELAAAEAELLRSHAPLLERVGLRVEPFGGSGVAVTAKPALSRRTPAATLLREVLGRLENADAGEPERLLDEVLHGMACKAAIKAGDPLSRQEIDALVSRREGVEDSHHCPHGRPTTLKLSRQELDRQFRRT